VRRIIFERYPATLQLAWLRVAGNQGARTPGVDGRTVAHIEAEVGVPAFLDDVRARLAVLSEIPHEFADAIVRWSAITPRSLPRWPSTSAVYSGRSRRVPTRSTSPIR